MRFSTDCHINFPLPDWKTQQNQPTEAKKNFKLYHLNFFENSSPKAKDDRLNERLQK